MAVPAGDLGLYEWAGRTIERHRAQIRSVLGFRECSVADADKLTPIDPIPTLSTEDQS